MATPTSPRLLGINDLNDVFQECKQFSAEWEMIGVNLGVASTTIAIIKRDNPNSCEQCMYQMLAKWLQRENEKCVPNWRSLCQSLRAEVGKSTADQIAEKYCVTDYSEEKELKFRSEKEKTVAAAKHLKEEFLKLLTVAYLVVSAADVGLFKFCITWFLNSARLTTPQIQQHLVELCAIPTSLGILIYLVSNKFIGYLNYKLLKEFQTMLAKSEELKKHVEIVGSKELKTDIEIYDRKHDEFIHSVSFNCIIDVFKQYPDLAPASHIGLPEFKIHLRDPWKDKYVYEWTEFFELHLTWPPYLFVTEVSKSSIILTYAVLPIFVSSVVRDLTNPEVLRELEEIGVKVQLSKELLEINSLMSKPATINYHREEEKQTALSKQLSSSDGCVHVLGMKEHSSLTTRRSAMERLSDSNREYTLCIHKVTSKLSVIDILHLQVTETQLRSLLYAVSSSEVELYQQMKDSELKSELPDKKDEWLVSELTSEEKMSEEYQYVQFVPIEVHLESQLAAKVAEKRILSLTSHITEKDEEVRQLKEELHKKTKELQSSKILTKEEQELDGDLYEAVKNQHVFKSKLLLNKGANPNKKHGWDQQTPLHLSSKSGRVIIVHMLLFHGADIRVKDWDQQTPLHLSSKSGHVIIVNMLLFHGADIHVKDRNQQTPLHLSSSSGHADIVNALLSHGADIGVKDRLAEQTPLHLSSQSGHVDIVNKLLSCGADIHVKDGNQQTPLHLSSASSHVDIVNALLSHGADVHVKDRWGHSPLDLARNPPPYLHIPEYRKRNVIKILKREEKKLRK